MAQATIHYFSRSLQKASALNVIFPDDPEIPRPWCSFYLLHGLSDDHTIWSRRTSIERYVESLPMVVVMPDSGRGWYTNAHEGYAYEDDLVIDIVGLIDRTFPVKAERNGRAIGGLSMGGYGAVKVGCKHHEMFASITSHSGALAVARQPESGRRFGAEFDRIFGTQPSDGPDDPFAIVRHVDHGLLPKLRLDCGVDDFLLDQNRSFHAHLNELRIAHEYHEFPGAHDWAYWDKHVSEAVAFHARNMGIQHP
jgi:S-formylglutathione hydrolase FrmB